MKKTWISLSLLAGVLAVTSPVSAQETTSESLKESEVSVRALLSPDGDATALFGGAGISHRSGPVYFGGAGYGGPVVTQRRGGFGYGGVLLGAATEIAAGTFLDGRLLVGGGGGAIDGNGAGSFVLEPSIALGVVLPAQSKLAVTAGYLYMPTASDFSGATLGLRFTR
jgi:hypothetical protein